jgi:hypothetical protein
MPYIRKGGQPLAAVLVVCLLPAVVSAQEPPSALRTPTIAASIASAADWATTYHALRNFQVRESNPLLRSLDSTPGRMITMGAAIDVATFSAWNLTMGKKHPRIAAAGLWGMAAFRTYLAVHNIRSSQRAQRR